MGHLRELDKPSLTEIMLVALPIITIAWQVAALSVLEISHEYFPAASLRSLLRTSRMLEKLVVLTLYLYEAQMGFPSFVQLT